MPPRVNNRIGQAVGETENGQGTRNCQLNAPATVGRLRPIAVHVHYAGDEVGHPGDDETSGGEEHHLNRLPLAQRFIGSCGRLRAIVCSCRYGGVGGSGGGRRSLGLLPAEMG